MRPLETAPSSCPARPTRCSPRATDFGDSTWITRSTAPMSMPSSSDEVATRHGISPFFKQLLHLDALLAGERAVVRAGELALGQLVQPQGQPLRQPPVVDEDDRRPVLLDETGGSPGRSTARSSGRRAPCPRPSPARPQARDTRARCWTAARACPPRARRPRGRAPSRAPRRRARSRGHRRRSGRSPRAAAAWPRGRSRCTGRRHELVEALDGQREVGAALRPGDGVHLVEDQRLDRPQHLACL